MKLYGGKTTFCYLRVHSHKRGCTRPEKLDVIVREIFLYRYFLWRKYFDLWGPNCPPDGALSVAISGINVAYFCIGRISSLKFHTSNPSFIYCKTPKMLTFLNGTNLHLTQTHDWMIEFVLMLMKNLIQ